ncbi:hypothetical protein N431DRAFT_483789 [Stipitochalara longipes BDJ]|nr:hypothetical protein N431DRAFT_483789 [Stipitochalara longipes BDJ]
MSPITEIISIELNPLMNTKRLSISGSHIWQKAISQLTSQPGCLGLQWSRRVEDPDWLVIKIDWSTREAHASSDSHKRFEELIAPLSNYKGLVRDAAIYEPLTASEVFFASPITEILTLLVPSSISSEEMVAFERACVKVSTSTAYQPNGVKAGTHAWLITEVDHPESTTGKAKALRFLLAWPSLELHRAVMATEEFKMGMGPIKQKCLPALYGRGMFHAEFTKANSYQKVDT